MHDENSSASIRVMALHALAYCERLFYLEEVEEIRVADEAAPQSIDTATVECEQCAHLSRSETRPIVRGARLRSLG